MAEVKKTALEAIFGSVVVEGGGTVLAMGHPLAALLPVLTNSFAYGRFSRRIESTLSELNAELEALGDKVDNLSDAQFRLTVGIVKTIFETTDEEKLKMLKAAILNAAGLEFLEEYEAQLFSRILRDVSAAEISFLADRRHMSAFVFSTTRVSGRTGILPTEPGRTAIVAVIPDTVEATIVRGLVNLGLIARRPSEGTRGDTGEYAIAPFVDTLLDLIEGSGVARGG